MKRHAQHQALVRRGNGLQVEAIPTKSPEAGGLLVELSFVGVCGTDLQILNGSRPDTAEILGHEGGGVVVEAAVGARLSRGQHVVFNPVAQPGAILGHNTPGLFQRYITVSADAVEQGLVLPAQGGLPPIYGTLVEPLGSIIYAHELVARLVPDARSVAVFGAGPIGLLAAIHLRQSGIRVVLIHPGLERLDTAIALGLVDESSTLLNSGDVTKQILARCDGKEVDAALICTTRRGAPEALQHAVQIVKSGGCIDMITNYPETAPTPAGVGVEAIRGVRAANVCGDPREGKYVVANISGRQIVFTGHRGTSASHLTRAMSALRSSDSRYRNIITHVLSLRDAARAIQTLAESPTRCLNGRDCIKAVIDLTATKTGYKLESDYTDRTKCFPR